MLIAITEVNAWENERWTYVLDINKQSGGAMNYLMIFIRLANEQFELVKEVAPYPTFGGIKVFAASKYWFKFYESIDSRGYKPRLYNKERGQSIYMSQGGDYKSGGIMLDAVISPRKAKSAMLEIRDKKNNILYKDFESIFLSKKSISTNASNKKKIQKIGQ